MKKQIVYIHGGSSFSEHGDFLQFLRTATVRDLPGEPTKTRWRDTLAEDLGEDFELFTPRMPNSQNAQYEEWNIWFERHFSYLHGEVILVGHSLGGIFLAKYLSEEETPFKVSNLYLLAAPMGDFIDDSQTGEDCGTFRFDPEILTTLAKKPLKISLWHSKDDPIVPYKDALEYKKYLPEADLVTFEDKNHFLLEEFPEFIREIKGL